MGSILVLGATGKVGRRLVPHLRSAGFDVRAASRKASSDTVVFDWQDAQNHEATLRGITALCLVPPEMVADPSDMIGPFLDVARRTGVERIAAISSLGVTFPHEPERSGRRKLESLVVGSGLSWTLLQPSGFYQNFSEGFLLPGILHGGAIATATGDGAVSLVDADDIARVAAAALTEPGHGGRTYPVTGPVAFTFDQAAALISQASGRQVTHEKQSADAMLGALLGFGVPPDYAEILVRDQVAISEGAGATVSDTVASVTNRSPISFQQYVAGAAPTWSAS